MTQSTFFVHILLVYCGSWKFEKNNTRSFTQFFLSLFILLILFIKCERGHELGGIFLRYSQQYQIRSIPDFAEDRIKSPNYFLLSK